MPDFKCCRCGDGFESGKSFIPIDPHGKNRRWCCTQCAKSNEKEKCKERLGDALKITRIFDNNFLRGERNDL